MVFKPLFPSLSSSPMAITNICLITMSSYHHINVTRTQRSYLLYYLSCPKTLSFTRLFKQRLRLFLSHFHSLFNQSPKHIVSTFKFPTSDHRSQSGLKPLPHKACPIIFPSFLPTMKDHASWEDVDLLTRDISQTQYSSLHH